MLLSFLIMLVAYLGIVIGYALGRIAPEERKPLSQSVHYMGFFGAAIAFIAALMSSYPSYHTVFITMLALFLISVNCNVMMRFPKRQKLALSCVCVGFFVVLSSQESLLFSAAGAFIYFSSLSLLETTSKISSLGKLTRQTFWFFAPLPFLLI